MPDVHAILGRLLTGRHLSEAETEELFELILSGGLDEAQIAGVLSLIQVRRVSVDELVGAARVMRRQAVGVPCAIVDGVAIVDTCGTGGAAKTFNISTAAAIVAAAAGPGRVRIAKHGNRSRSGRGSAEVLAKLGVNVDASPAVQGRCLEQVGVCFCFAIHHHPAAKHAAGARKSLGFPTIFNLLGPLTNPAGATRQVIGVYEAGLVETMARALSRLGAERAMVVHGMDGMDEITTTARTAVGRVEGGRVTMEEFDAAWIGVPRRGIQELRAADLDESARMVRGVVEGSAGPAREIVELNAGAALMVGGVVEGIGAGLELARAAIDSGAARETLARLVTVSNGGT
jgi:anthranilate phosphoribosyltransferase